MSWLALLLAAAVAFAPGHAPRRHHTVPAAQRAAKKPPRHAGALRNRAAVTVPHPSASPVPVIGGATPTPTATATPAPTATPDPSRTGVDLNDKDDILTLVPTYRVLKAGTVTFNAVNFGADPHNLTVEDDAGDDLASVDLPSDPVDLPTHTVSLDLAPGRYTLFCNVPGHRAAGMEATVTVR